MGDLITVQQRNIEELGFPEDLHGKADGLFLDLPGPWHVCPMTNIVSALVTDTWLTHGPLNTNEH